MCCISPDTENDSQTVHAGAHSASQELPCPPHRFSNRDLLPNPTASCCQLHFIEPSCLAQAKALSVDPQTSDPYTALLEATVVPGVASAVTNTWEPRDPEAALAWMDAWQDALPPGVQVTILDTLRFPKVTILFFPRIAHGVCF